MKASLALLLLPASYAWGQWVGEDLLPTQLRPFGLSVLALACLPFLPFLQAGRAKRAVVAVALVAASFSGFLVGDRISTAAFNSCVRRGDEVRAALSSYHSTHGRFPQSLDLLELPDLPGKRFLRDNILTYESSGEDYRLVFADWLVEHSATRDGWEVRK